MINKKHPLAGLCYVLSEAFYHLHGRHFGLKPARLRYYGVVHWWLETPDGQIIDFTKEQYSRPFPYRRGRRGGFLTKLPCKRTKEILNLLTK
jgi:hypothetical protein